MNLLKRYANQSLTRKTPASVSKYNEITWTSTTIKGRKEPTNKLIRNDKGEEVVTSTFVMTESLVLVGDMIDDQRVLLVDALPNLAGTTEFYEVYLA